MGKWGNGKIEKQKWQNRKNGKNWKKQEVWRRKVWENGKFWKNPELWKRKLREMEKFGKNGKMVKSEKW